MSSYSLESTLFEMFISSNMDFCLVIYVLFVVSVSQLKTDKPRANFIVNPTMNMKTIRRHI